MTNVHVHSSASGAARVSVWPHIRTFANALRTAAPVDGYSMTVDGRRVSENERMRLLADMESEQEAPAGAGTPDTARLMAMSLGALRDYLEGEEFLTAPLAMRRRAVQEFETKAALAATDHVLERLHPLGGRK